MDHSPSRILLLLPLAAAAIAALLLWPGRQDAGAGDVTTITTTTTSAPPLTAPVATGLDPGLQRALAAATVDAAAAGHTLTVTSGFRTATEQARLLEEAIAEHGSEAAALRWVFTPERSMHVRGLAVDVGNGPAADWLEDHGAAFGLCRTLAWEWWHFEWRAAWEASGTCPRPVDEPTDAPLP